MNKVLLATTALAGATVALAYSASLEASGGTAPYSFQLVDGTLPDGLSLDAASGAITGTPAAEGAASFSLTATDVNGDVSDPVALSISVSAPQADAEPAPQPVEATPPAHESLLQEIENKLHELHDHVEAAAEKAEAEAETVLRAAYADLLAGVSQIREALTGSAS